ATPRFVASFSKTRKVDVPGSPFPGLLIHSRLAWPSLATKMSGQPSPSKSAHSTPSPGPSSTPRPDARVTSLKRTPFSEAPRLRNREVTRPGKVFGAQYSGLPPGLHGQVGS